MSFGFSHTPAPALNTDIYRQWNLILLMIYNCTKKALTIHLQSCLLHAWLQMLALDVKMEAFETLKVAHCLAKQCLSLYFAVGCGGSQELKWASCSCWRLRRKLKSQSTFAVHWKCSCMAALTIPTAVKYRPWDFCCCGGLGLPPRVGSPLSRFGERVPKSD